MLEEFDASGKATRLLLPEQVVAHGSSVIRDLLREENLTVHSNHGAPIPSQSHLNTPRPLQNNYCENPFSKEKQEVAAVMECFVNCSSGPSPFLLVPSTTITHFSGLASVWVRCAPVRSSHGSCSRGAARVYPACQTTMQHIDFCS